MVDKAECRHGLPKVLKGTAVSSCLLGDDDYKTPCDAVKWLSELENCSMVAAKKNHGSVVDAPKRQVQCCREGVSKGKVGGNSQRCKASIPVTSRRLTNSIACALDAEQQEFDMACSSNIFTAITKRC